METPLRKNEFLSNKDHYELFLLLLGHIYFYINQNLSQM